MTVLLLSISLIIFPGTVLMSTTDCRRNRLERCLRMFENITEDVNLAFPTTDEHIDAVCSHLNVGMTCMDGYMRDCLTPQTLSNYKTIVNGIYSFKRSLCSDLSFREEILHHTVCYKKLSLMNCSKQYHIMREKTEITGEQNRRNLEETLKHSCCAFRFYSSCMSTNVNESCSSAAMAFLTTYLDLLQEPFSKSYCSSVNEELSGCVIANSMEENNAESCSKNTSWQLILAFCLLILREFY